MFRKAYRGFKKSGHMRRSDKTEIQKGKTIMRNLMSVLPGFFVAIAPIVAIICGYIGKRKNYGFIIFALLGLILPPVGLIVVLVIPENGAKRKGDPVIAPSPADELAKYKQLLDQGVISPEEFERKKEEIMNIK